MFRWVLVVLAGCYSPEPLARCQASCTKESDCADGLTCDLTDGLCNTPGFPSCSSDPPPTTCVTDDFTTLARWHPRANGTCKLPIVERGKLRFQCDDLAMGESIATSAMPIDLTAGPFQIELVQPPENLHGGSDLNIALTDGASSLNLIAQTDALFGFVNNSSPVTAMYDPSLQRHLQIRAASGMAVFETSPDRASWQLIGTQPLDFAVDHLTVDLRLQHNGVGSQAVVAELDNFTFASGCNPVVAPILRDGFDTGSGDLAGHPAVVGGSWRSTGIDGGTVLIGSLESDGFINHGNANEAFYLNSSDPGDADYDIEADGTFQNLTTGSAGLVAHGSDMRNGYLLMWAVDSSMASHLELYRATTAQPILIGSCVPTMFFPTEMQTHRLRLRIRGPELTGYFDGQLMCLANETSGVLVGPGTGVTFTGNDPIELDHILVTRP